MHGKYGQTLAKMASNVKLYSLDETSMIGFRRAFLQGINSAGCDDMRSCTHCY